METRVSRRFRSTQEKRQIVEETLREGASVSVVARAHEVNTNQVFHWRKLYREARLELEESASQLVPVRVRDVAVKKVELPGRRKSNLKRTGIIDIDLGHARVRIEGAVDPDCVRAALAGLLR